MDTNPAQPSDLADRGFDVTTEKVAQTRLDEAWRALNAEVPSLSSRIDAGQLDPNIVVDVLCSAAMRVLRNPEGFSRFAGGIDDYREDWTIPTDQLSNDLYFTTAELRRVQPPAVDGFAAGSMAYS